ncbi:hypothetical protein PU560_08305 [Georgenia sp. 10Sc9-8]|uniref:PQQ-binding-like beta-propeller repeat protein n=1 Tax=Georgenia halotolerans TaxID=3028317 RepID=A0ABT5U034_9MICO|nr:hypothetical protein [Georgenia halotolerans]
MPEVGWQLSPDDVDAPIGDPVFVDPRAPRIGADSWPTDFIMDAGDAWITAVMGLQSSGPSSLVGVEPRDGSVRWVHDPPPDETVVACAAELLQDALACVVGDGAEQTAVTLVDASSGTVSGTFALPAPARTIGVVGQDVVVVLDGALHGSTRIIRYTSDGEEVWSSAVEVDDQMLATEYYEGLVVTPVSIVVNLGGAVRVLTPDEGAVVFADGPVIVRARPDGSFLVDSAGFGPTGTVTFHEPDGTVLADYPGYRMLPPLLRDGPAVWPLLVGPDNGVYHWDETEKALVSTQAHLAEGGDASTSLTGTTLLVSEPGLLRAVDTSVPEELWRADLDLPYWGVVADELGVYAVVQEAAAVTGIRLSDGSAMWELPLPEGSASDEDGTETRGLEHVGEHVVLAGLGEIAQLAF